VRNRALTFKQQLLDVAQAQLKAEIPPHSATDDFGWEPMTVIERFRILHRSILRSRANNLTMPIRVIRHRTIAGAQIRDTERRLNMPLKQTAMNWLAGRRRLGPLARYARHSHKYRGMSSKFTLRSEVAPT
jgi:hypothetical protein